jgi:hypothetical protein
MLRASRFPTRGEAVAKRLKGAVNSNTALATRPHHRSAEPPRKRGSGRSLMLRASRFPTRGEAVAKRLKGAVHTNTALADKTPPPLRGYDRIRSNPVNGEAAT